MVSFLGGDIIGFIKSFSNIPVTGINSILQGLIKVTMCGLTFLKLRVREAELANNEPKIALWLCPDMNRL